MKKETKLVQTAKHIDSQLGAVNPPIYRTSTVLFPDLKSYLNAEKGIDCYATKNSPLHDDPSYGITGTATTNALQEAMQTFDGGDYSLILPSGMAAISFTLLAVLAQGDHVLIPDSCYGPTRRFCNKELKKLGIEATYYDPLIGAKIHTLFKENTKAVFAESPGSLTFEVQDIPAISKACKKRDICLILDNSWASGYYFDAFSHGVDISIQAGTKYIGGHSDLLLGTVTCTKQYSKALFNAYRNHGWYTSPDDCYVALRGLRTVATRIKHHETYALKMAKALKKHPKVKAVLHPALPSCPGHKIWKRDFTGSTGLFSVILKKKYDQKALAKMIDPMKCFGIGASWGGYESLILAFDPSPIRTVTSWPYEGSALRLYIGLENYDDLLQDVLDALKRLK